MLNSFGSNNRSELCFMAGLMSATCPKAPIGEFSANLHGTQRSPLVLAHISRSSGENSSGCALPRHQGCDFAAQSASDGDALGVDQTGKPMQKDNM